MHEALCPQRICNLSLISSLGLFIVTFPKQTTRQLKHGLRQRGLGTLYWFRAAGRTPAWGTEEPPSFSLLNSVGFLQSPVSASRIHATPHPTPAKRRALCDTETPVSKHKSPANAHIPHTSPRQDLGFS